MVVKFNISLNRKSLSESSENGRRMRFSDKSRVDNVSILKGTSSQIVSNIILFFMQVWIRWMLHLTAR